MRDEFSKDRCLGQEGRRLLEAAEKTVSRSLCLWFVVSQSVMLVERFVCFAEQNALSCGEDVWLWMCGGICVVFDNNNNNVSLSFFRRKKTETVEGQLCPKRLLHKSLPQVSCVSCFEEGAEPLVVDFH